MCEQHSRLHWFYHLTGQCEHYQKVSKIQTEIIKARKDTNKDLKRFNQELNVLIKDENIRITLTNIRKVANHV